jgi:hypothetical protein
MPRFHVRVLSSFFLGLGLAAVAAAQTSPCTPESPSAGSAEDRLAAIRVVADPLQKIMEEMGNPSGRVALPGEEGKGQIQYQWQEDGTTLFVTTSYVTDSSGNRAETVRAVEITAPENRKSKWKTGRGIGLGVPRKKVESTYGATYQTDQFNGQERLTYCFDGGSWLAFLLDGDGRVARIHLEGPAQ